ncbi:hypothetical protein [Corynebacterium pilosum]|nr:hypothetical protein [Corynebacterium pilosum]
MAEDLADLHPANAQIVTEALQPVFAEVQERLGSALYNFPSFTAGLTNTMRAVETSNLLRDLKGHALPPILSFPAIESIALDKLQDAMRIHDSWVEDLQARLVATTTGFRRTLFPPNLRQLADEITAEEVNRFVEKEAIPLYLVPKGRTALRLIRAKDRQARRKVLNSCFNSIVDDCEKILTESRAESIADQVSFIRDGIGALRAGYTPSAQAMFTVTLDTLITRLYPDQENLRRIRNRQKDKDASEEFDQMNIREALVWLPIWNAHESFWPNKGDPVPHHFSRHASVHAVTSRQFNKRNCIQALMLVTSLVGYGNALW